MIVIPLLFLPGLNRKATAAREARLAEVSSELGLTVVDDLDISALPFQITAAGKGARVGSARKGVYKGMEVFLFDLAWDEEITSYSGGVTTTDDREVRRTCVMAPLTNPAAHIIVADPDAIPDHAKITKGPTPDALRNDWEFRGDADYADAMTDDRMIEYLSGLGNGWYFELSREKILCLRPYADAPDTIPQRLDGVLGLIERLPTQW
jgi:hypothetical protein